MTSKIKVDTIENVSGSGNVSLGSGHNLVVPGTVSVTGASTLTGGVTSSAAHTVTTTTHANASVFKSTGNTQIMLQDTDASANDQFWGLQNSGGDFNILTCNDDRASGFVTPMTITQAGLVSMPNTPSFAGREPRPQDSDGYTSIGAIYWNTVSHNNGNHFNNSNGNFTCPITGYYLCLAFCLIDNNAGASELCRTSWKKNGTEMLVAYDNGHDSGSSIYDGMLSTGGIIQASANDVLTFNVTHGKIHVGAESQASIHLLA
tara:strand:- start:1079 stop:1861 length:783 start_codon:yes stop_codon:yes gene_type:complete